MITRATCRVQERLGQLVMISSIGPTARVASATIRAKTSLIPVVISVVHFMTRSVASETYGWLLDATGSDKFVIARCIPTG